MKTQINTLKMKLTWSSNFPNNSLKKKIEFQMLIILYGYSFSKFYSPLIIIFTYEKLKEASGRSRFYPMVAWPRV
jgi:hypothetical protein